MFYIDNFALRILFCVGTAVLASLLGAFVRAEFIVHEAMVIDTFKNLVLPVALGLFAGVIWKKPEKKQPLAS